MAAGLVKGMFLILLLIFVGLAMLALVQPMLSAVETAIAAIPPAAEVAFPPAKNYNHPLDLVDSEIALLLSTTVVDPAYKAVTIDEYSHAETEHPEDAPIVRECLRTKGAYMQFQIEPKKRYLRVCVVDDVKGILGFQIVDIVQKEAKELTAYIKDDIRSIKQLLDFAARRGYHRFRGSF